MHKSIFISTLFFISIYSISAQESQQSNKEKINTLNEVAIVKEKKAVEQKADRTIFDFSGQAYLNSGSLLEGIKKLPGLIATDIAGMLYQGKQLDVYLDGRPLNISSNELNSFLDGMPANSVERIEVITQPGAEFPATSGGAILNIITNKKAKNYLSATYTNSTSFSNNESIRWRANNGLMLSAKNKLFGWQLNIGQNYAERGLWNEVIKTENNTKTLLNKSDADRINRNYYAKSGLTFDFGADRLLLNYDLIYNKNNSYTNAFGELPSATTFQTSDKGDTKNTRQDAVATFQKRFENKAKKLDFSFNYNRMNTDFMLNSVTFNTLVLDNSSLQELYNFKADYSQPLKILDEGKMSFGTLYEELFFKTKNEGITNLDYQRRTASTYLEFQAKLKKIDFILGGRAEDYDISGKTDTGDLIPFKQFRFFPNASVQYNFSKQVYFNLNYSKKISLPSTSVLNPNNTTYQNPNAETIGNPQLQPTIYNNFEAKISAIDYAFLSYNLSVGDNQVVQRILYENDRMINTNINVSQLRSHSINFGMPIPYMLFTKGLAETMKMNVNPDEMNFLYVFAGRQLHEIPNIKTKAFWYINLMSQVVLPQKVKWMTTYNFIPAGGNYYYFGIDKPLNASLNMNFSKKFLNNQLSVSINLDDILNTNKGQLNSRLTPLTVTNKNDTRRYGFSINYKIPTKNKLAKEDPNMLNKDKKEDNGTLIGN